jgi:uncharacterized UPF0146 family protein
MLIERHSPGEDGDDRKREGKVREAADRSKQILRISEAAQLVLVLTPLVVDRTQDEYRMRAISYQTASCRIAVT